MNCEVEVDPWRWRWREAGELCGGGGGRQTRAAVTRRL